MLRGDLEVVLGFEEAGQVVEEAQVPADLEVGDHVVGGLQLGLARAKESDERQEGRKVVVPRGLEAQLAARNGLKLPASG